MNSATTCRSPKSPPDLQRAVVAVEDRRFFLHPGIDPIGVVRAVVRDVRSGERAEGGSTLTQQLARTLFLSNSRTYARKGKEASIALLLEFELSKPQILELYLNRVYLSAGVYGVQTMAEHLYRKPASAVTLPEAALIAGLIRAPSTLSPWSNYDGALERSHVVLALMREQKFITPAQEAAARKVRPAIQPYRQSREGASGWAKDYLRQQYRNQFGGDSPPDWKILTTFERPVQAAAEQAVAAGLRRLNKPGLEAAFVALDPLNGNILAMVGGADYARSTFNRATRSRRQPGSAFKPIVYAAALVEGVFTGVPFIGVSEGVGAWRSGMDSAKCRERVRGSIDAPRGAPRIEQRRRRGSSATYFVEGGPAPRVGLGAARFARRPVAGAGDRGRDTAGSDSCLFDFSFRRRIQYATRRAVGLRW